MPALCLIRTGEGTLRTFTDPTQRPRETCASTMPSAHFWGSVGEPDNFHFPPFLAACSAETLKLLARSRLLPNILCHLERLARKPMSSSSSSATLIMSAASTRSYCLRGRGKLRADLILFQLKLVHEVIAEQCARLVFVDRQANRSGRHPPTLRSRFPFPKARPRPIAGHARAGDDQSRQRHRHQPAQTDGAHSAGHGGREAARPVRDLQVAADRTRRIARSAACA